MIKVIWITAQNGGRTSLNVCQGPKGEKKLQCLEMIFRTSGTKKKKKPVQIEQE